MPLLGAAPGAGTSSSSGSRFLEQMSATLLVLSDQPKTVPPIEPSRAKAVAKGLPTDMRLALRELEAVKRERDGLQAKVRGGVGLWLGNCCRAPLESLVKYWLQ